MEYQALPPPLLTRYVDIRARIQMGPSHITIQGDGAVAFTALPDFLGVREIFHAVCHYIGVGTSPVQRVEFHDRDEPCQIVNLCLRILSVHQPRKIEQLSTLCIQRS